MTGDFLADLDAAVEQRCACPCRRPITDWSPSAYFASELCSKRWHRQTCGITPDAARSPAAEWRDLGTVSADLIAEALLPATSLSWSENLAQAVRAWVDAFMPVLGQIREQAQRFASHLAACSTSTGPPLDPMEYALWARRNRNTGPRPEGRAPRRVDPAGGFRTEALGRQEYRPTRS